MRCHEITRLSFELAIHILRFLAIDNGRQKLVPFHILLLLADKHESTIDASHQTVEETETEDLSIDFREASVTEVGRDHDGHNEGEADNSQDPAEVDVKDMVFGISRGPNCGGGVVSCLETISVDGLRI
jgi:hypothetical protein